MIGRNDQELFAPLMDSIPDLIISVCRRWWPSGCFQDADEDEVIDFGDPRLVRHRVSNEFFVYKTRQTADEWDELGPTPDRNWNEMLHFIIRPYPSTETNMYRVTMVFDENTPSLRRMTADLEATFLDADSLAEIEAA